MNGDATELPAKLTTSAGADAPDRPRDRAPARPPARAGRSSGETALEWIIRFCGVSAILFVFGIFFFVFREGAGLLFGGLELGQFLFSTEWFPTSHSNVRYGVLRADRRHGQRDRAGHGDRGALRAGRRRSSSPSSAASATKETLKIVIELLAAIPSVVWGFIGISRDEPAHPARLRRAGRAQRAQRRRSCSR